MGNITQADRDRAADYFYQTADYPRSKAARDGSYDLSVCVQSFARHRLAAEATQAAEIARLRTRLAQFEMALTPSGETKYIHIGGYSFTEGLPDWIDEDGEEHPPAPARVPWTTTKEIMAKIMTSVDGFVPRSSGAPQLSVEGASNG